MEEEAKGDGEGDCPGVRVGVGAICCRYICQSERHVLL
jgi:hypothetical protein